MNCKQYVFLLFLAAASGLVGGALGGWYAAPVLAQATAPKLVTAQEFRLVDENGSKRGELSLVPDGEPRLFLYGKNGYVVWSAPPTAKFHRLR